MCGRATLTMVASSTTMSCAVAMTARATPRRRDAPVVAIAGAPSALSRGCVVDMTISLKLGRARASRGAVTSAGCGPGARGAGAIAVPTGRAGGSHRAGRGRATGELSQTRRGHEEVLDSLAGHLARVIVDEGVQRVAVVGDLLAVDVAEHLELATEARAGRCRRGQRRPRLGQGAGHERLRRGVGLVVVQGQAGGRGQDGLHLP